MKIVVIGGTGLMGSKIVAKLDERGYEALAASPITGVNTLTGEGLADALAGASAVIDVSNSPSWEDDAVLAFFETATGNLLGAATAAAVGHHVALSVVGSDRLPERYRMDAFFRQVLADRDDPREVVADEHARYFGSELSERSLVPLGEAILGETRYADWHDRARSTR
jgi:hypothetical protein